MNIWIVDDAKSFREELRHRLTGTESPLHILAIEEFDGETDLLNRFESFKTPDFILMDIQMEAKDSGIRCIQKLKQAFRLQPRVKQPLIIVLTVDEDIETIISALNWGAWGYINKSKSDIQSIPKTIHQSQSGVFPLSERIANRIFKDYHEYAHKLMLTPREAEVLLGIAQSFELKQMAEILQNSTETITTHIKNITAKLSDLYRDQFNEMADQDIRQTMNEIRQMARSLQVLLPTHDIALKSFPINSYFDPIRKFFSTSKQLLDFDKTESKMLLLSVRFAHQPEKIAEFLKISENAVEKQQKAMIRKFETGYEKQCKRFAFKFDEKRTLTKVNDLINADKNIPERPTLSITNSATNERIRELSLPLFQQLINSI